MGGRRGDERLRGKSEWQSQRAEEKPIRREERDKERLQDVRK